MNDNLTSNNIDHDELTKNISENDYKNLIIRLKKIRTTISLLEKLIFQ